MAKQPRFCDISEIIVDCSVDGPLIGTDGKVWPCCFVHTNHHNSDEIMKYNKEDPNWNNLYHYPLSKILNHEAFTQHFNIPHFSDIDNLDYVCRNECLKNNIK